MTPFQKVTALLVGVAAATALAACSAGGGNAGSGTSASGSGGATDKSFIFISSDPIGINKFLESGKVGTTEAGKKYAGAVKIFEPESNDSSRQAQMDGAVAEDPDVIVTISFSMTDITKAAAEANPDIKFLLIDDCPADGMPDNMYCGVFREQEPSYLLGIEAGNLTKVDKVGSVMSLDIPFLHRYADSFALGAQSVKSDITDEQRVIGGDSPFADPAKAKEVAMSLASTGADHVFAVGAGSNGGVFEAGAEAGFFSYGVDVNQCPMQKGVVVDSTIKAVNVVVVDLIGKILDGTAEPITSYGLKENGMNIASLTDDNADCLIMDHPDVLEKVKEAKQQIIDGTITIPDPVASS